MSAVAARLAPRAPSVGPRLALAVVVIVSAIAATILVHRGDSINAEATSVDPSPSSMF